MAVELIGELGEALRTAPDFETACDALIRAGRRLFRSMLTGRRAVATIGVGKVYLYPDTPRVVVHTERDQRALPPSQTAWNLIAEHGRPLILGAETGKATIFLETGVEVRQLKQGPTRQAMIAHGVTHLHVLPLFGAGGPIGALSFAVKYQTLFDFEDIDDDVEFLERAMTIAQMTAGRFALLPRRDLTDALCDAHVPVAGSRTLSILKHVQRYADRTDPMVLRGPIGSGRTHIARWCHARSGRTGPFIIFDPTTGPAQAERLTAAWTKAAAGTLLVRRPDRLDTAAQELLLAWCHAADPAHARLILHADTRWLDAVKAQTFDAELTARVQDLVVPISPLRERPEEIDAWATRFALLAGGRVSFSPDALRFLKARSWNDNLIGLRAVVRQARDNALEMADDTQGAAVIERHHLTRVPYVSQGESDHARQEATLLAGLDAAAEVLIHAGKRANGARIEGMAGLVLWRLGHLAGGRIEALDLLGRSPSTGNAARTWRRKIEPAIELAEQLGLHSLVRELKER